MHRSIFKKIVFISFLFPSVFIRGENNADQSREEKKEIGTDYQRVNGLENWTYDYDISDFDDGKYNLIIRSRDKAGNLSIDGPINIFIDSESDMPVSSISSPSRFMRVGGNFTIVGTASDDDGLSFVEYKIGEGSWRKADGSQFWSAHVDTAGWTDGKYSLHTRAVDINGITGPEYSLDIHLDKSIPTITIASHNNGEILSGRNRISGIVNDANGVFSLEYSLDGELWETLRLSGKSESVERNFSLDIDTREGEGGTSYVRFRSRDNTGSVGTNAFVYYSDNEKPEISIISPAEGESVNGKITISGSVSDDVGIASFSSMRDGGDAEEIPLIPGNPYWAKTFDYRGLKDGTITFRAVDLTGNAEEIRYRFKTAFEEDKPLVSFVDFVDGEYLDLHGPVLKGIVSDDDGVAAFRYSIDGGELQEKEATGSFILDLSYLEPGKHNLQFFGVDINGVEGNQEKVSFFIAGEEPLLVPTEYTRDKEVLPWFDGAVFRQGRTAKISGRIEGGEGELKLYLSIDGQEEIESKVANGQFSIAIPGKPEPGVYDMVLRTVDSLGRNNEVHSRISFAPSPGKDEEFIPVQQDQNSLYISDLWFQGTEPVNIELNNPLTGYIAGDSISSIELDPPHDSFEIEKRENNFIISPIAEAEPYRFKIRILGSSGAEYISDEIFAASDTTAPVLNIGDLLVPRTDHQMSQEGNQEKDPDLTGTSIEKPEGKEIASTVLQDSLILRGSVSETNITGRMEVSFSGSSGAYGAPFFLDLNRAEGGLFFDEDIDLSSIFEGEHFLTLSLSDQVGNVTRKTLPFSIDRTAPQIQIVSPRPEETVEGIITVSGRIDGFDGRGKLLFSRDGIHFDPVELASHNTFFLNMDLSDEATDVSQLQFRAIDSGRNQSVFKPQLNIDLETDRPTALIEAPSAGTTIRNDFSLTGLVFDDDAVASIFYSIDGGDYVKIDGNFYYNIPFSLDELVDGEHNIRLYAEDSGGFPSEVVERYFKISKAEPVSTIISPAIDDFIKSTVKIEGRSYDDNGVEQVYISYDNGVTYNEATVMDSDSAIDEERNISWNYSFDTRLPGDGTHSILIKAIDGAGTVGISSTIINIDNTSPEIKLDSPGESSLFAGQLILDGKVFDERGIKNVVTEINALEDPDFSDYSIEIETKGVFRESFDIRQYNPGWYNLNITVTDHAENSISETRNFLVISNSENRSVEIFFPEEGKNISGPFAIDGMVHGVENRKILLRLDGNVFDTVEADENGLFSFVFEEKNLTEGRHTMQVECEEGNDLILSPVRNIHYANRGPWVRVENLKSGQFVSGRPMVTGTAGYNGLSEEETDKKNTVDFIEVSLDNGKTFTRAKGQEEWEFRLETYDLPEGINQLLIRAHFKDESIAVTKLFVNIDETAPVVELFYPEENRTFNGSIPLVGTAEDENGLESVEVLIREGSKERYEVPSFIQGLYIDFHALGSTYGELGVGLSFFDDIVKLQVQAGLAPPGRFTGIVIGAKLLATVLEVPFSYFFGYDWDFFSMSLAVGANFNYFSMSPDGYSFTDKGVVLGAVLIQYEFAKFEIEKWSLFNSYSLYTEAGLWFISSDIEAGVTPTISFGARIGIF